MPTESVTGYRPTEEDLCSLAEWFEHYDNSSAAGDVPRTADLAVFPLNLVTDDSTGRAWCGQWDREQYLTTMGAVMGGDESDDESAEGTRFDSTRTPFFLSPSLAVVFSRSTMTVGGRTHQLDYADVLVRADGQWRFQTMLQPGWGDMLKGGDAG
ncbi:nuclear transport factor 2 family protein [Streptomyces alkaliterrae]|uniref:Nuclear transport factor 2 family protein n=1 Tax=Streptomyces alkaliterrae TaxID=2213162 RepID=A0A5P0YVV1_9ACTN|nr:nuclear transport factor 2 family protein [Streptomyces alkaliterrae]MBB1261033.1 nuclear transport factor 2 family protein [Streptomyces alkaliterrae]MQS04423.1 nuclear transport factor 2 family protein [Streptomyces alkaliterrae]